MSQATRTPVAVPAMIRSTLASGECVVWMGQPRSTPAAIASLIATVLGAALWLTMLLTVCREFGAVGVVFAVLGFVFWVVAFWAVFLWQRRANRRTFYVLSDRRAIIFVPQWRRGYRLFVRQPEDIAYVRHVAFRSGFGSIYWVEPISSPFSFLVGRWRGGFVAIDNAGEIQQLMYETFLPLLPARLKDPDPDVRRKAAKSFTVLGPIAAKALPSLLDALESEDSVIRRHIVSALGHLGEKGTCVIPTLRRLMLTDEDRKVAMAARAAVDEIRSCPSGVS